MTLQQLEYVIALDNHRHFVTAAEHCFVTQPTLTMQLKKLEEEIGIVIFDRSKKPITPTAAGKMVISKVREILREVSQLKELVSDEKETLTGNFKIGIIPTLAPTILPQFLGSFLKRYPKISLEINELKSSEVIRDVINGNIDIGIMVTPVEEKNIREIPLFYEPFYLFQNDDESFQEIKEVEPSDLEKSNLLLLSEGHCFRNQMLNICKSSSNNNPQIIYESGSIETLKNMVLSGLGLTLVPQLSISESEKKYCIPFKDPKPVREVSLVFHKSFSKELLIDNIRKTILESIPDNLQKNERFFRVKWK